MARQSITLANQNDEWLKKQVANEEFTSKSEVVNYLIQQARRQEEYYEFVRMKIEIGENSGLAKNKPKRKCLPNLKSD